MSMGGSVVEYLGKGLAASRPASPSLSSGAIGLYWATDDEELSLWDGSTWQEDIAGGVAPAFALDDLTDVDAPTPADGDRLTWDSGAGAWVPAPDASAPDAGDVGITDAGGYFTATDVEGALQEIGADIAISGATIVTEASATTIDPAAHAGIRKYIRAAGDLTFDSAEGYAAGEVYNIRATAALSLVESGVTLTEPYGGTLDLEAGMSVTVIMTSSTAGDVIGQTVPA